MDTVISFTPADRDLILQALTHLSAVRGDAWVGLHRTAPELMDGPHALTKTDFRLPEIERLMNKVAHA